LETTCYLSLGSNLGDRAATIAEAIQRLAAVGTVMAVSSLYETEPVEYLDQPWFLNCTVALRTAMPPRPLLDAVLAIEQSMGRRRIVLKGPRTIDIDILLYGGEAIETPELTVPHSALGERRFVLAPLAEIAPDSLHPVFRKTVRELLQSLPEDGPEVRLYGKLPRWDQ